MSDHDELLARADAWLAEVSRYPLTERIQKQGRDFTHDLAAALRAEESRYCWVCRGVHTKDDPRLPVQSHSAYVAGSATPTQEDDDG